MQQLCENLLTLCVWVCYYSYLWWATALLARTTAVKMAKAELWTEWPARAKPAHSVISPKKLAPDTYSNMPPVGGRQETGQVWSSFSLFPRGKIDSNILPWKNHGFPTYDHSISSLNEILRRHVDKNSKCIHTTSSTLTIDGWALTIWLQAMCRVAPLYVKDSWQIPDVPGGSFGAVRLTASFFTLFFFRARDGLFQQVHHKFGLKVLLLWLCSQSGEPLALCERVMITDSFSNGKK